jgi:hypothetical protein
MAKKYLTLQEAAKQIGITPDELAREREDGSIRGFANRGSWKFRKVDIDEFIRSRETDSSPEIPLEALELELDKDDDGDMTDLLGSSDSDVQLYSESSLFDDDEIADLKASDSDVRLTGDSGPLLEADDTSPSGQSEIDFGDDSVQALNDSDSDVKLVRAGTDPDINLVDVAPGGTASGTSTDDDMDLAPSLSGDDRDDEFDSDSDVKLTAGDGDTDDNSDIVLADSDSDVKLSKSETSSDIRLMGDDDGGETVMVALPEDSDLKLIDSLDEVKAADPDSGISLAAADEEDSGISLEIGDSGISLEADDSGISLEGVDSGFADDSGISLDGADSGFLGDSGISFDAGDSGISLDSGDSGIGLDVGDSGVALMADADSGISLDSDTATVQMDLKGEDLGLESSAVGVSATDGTSEFDLGLLDGEEQDTGTDTSILMFDGSEAEDDDMEMSAVGTDFADEEGDFDDDFADDFDDDELDDVFEADDDDGFESGQSQVGGFAVPAGVSAGVEAPWGTGVTTGVIIGSLFSVVGAFAGFELVRTMWMWFQPGGGESAFLQMIGGLFG